MPLGRLSTPLVEEDETALAPQRAWYPGSPLDMLLECATSSPGKVFVSDTEGRRLSYYDFFVTATRVAELIRPRGGVVAVAPINSVPGLLAVYAAWLSGRAVAIIDPLSGPWDLARQLGQVRARLLITHEWFAEQHCGAAAKLGTRCLVAEKLYEQARAGKTTREYERPRPWDEQLIYFYAGIAGKTLPVIHTGASLASSAWLTMMHYGYEPEWRVYVPVPISHGLGLHIGAFSPTASCSSLILYTKKGPLDPSEAAQSLASSRASIVFGVPLYYRALLKAGYRGHPGLVYAVSAGAPLSTELQQEWRRRTGAPLLQMYGMTEALPLIASKPHDPLGSLGKPLPGIETRLTEEPEGELLARGPVVMKGYGDPEANKKAFANGWLRTGDVLRRDEEGYYYFVRIKKPMLKYKAYPVLLGDLEELLLSHPDVVGAELGSTDLGDLGEAPVARVWLRRGSKASGATIQSWVNEKIAPWKRLYKVTIAGYK